MDECQWPANGLTYNFHRAIACGITRMVIFIEVLVPPRTCRYSALAKPFVAANLSVLANSRVAGLLATDDIGVVSLLLFWGMVELGVGMIAVCLPTLRPLFHGWSPESIIRSIRSALSIRSIHSGGSSARSTGRPAKDAQQVGSESSIVGINMEPITNGKASTEGTVTRVYGGEEGQSQTGRHGEGDIRVDREFGLSRQEV